MRRTDANPANNPNVTATLDSVADTFVQNALRLFEADLGLDGTDASVHRLSAALTIDRRDRWAGAGSGEQNLLFNAVVHGAAYVGRCIVRNHGGSWAVRSPLWESLVHLRSAAGEAELAPFAWWLRALSDDEIGTPGKATLADRYRSLVEVPCFDASSMPVVFGHVRDLPRLSKVRYDVFYKYIKAHLTELRDVGRDFPSPERFDQYAFRFLEFFVVGGGRMLVILGGNADGAHIFWLDGSGYQKSFFVPCRSFPDPLLKVDGDRLRLLVQTEDGTTVSHEMLWWGP